MENLSIKKVLAKLLSTRMVIESGTDGIWTYRKWSDGTAECWGVKKLTGLLINSTWGNGFLGNMQAAENFPTGFFNEAPVVFASPGKIGSDGTWTMGLMKSDTGPTTKDSTGNWAFFRTSKQDTAVTASVFFYAIGTWATFDPSSSTLDITGFSQQQMSKQEVENLITASGNIFKENDTWVPSDLT